MKIKEASYSNKTKEIEVSYSNGKVIVVHYGALGIENNISNLWIDSQTRGKTLGIEYQDGDVDYMPYDQPLAIVKDPEYVLQNQIEHLIASINETLIEKGISKKYLARQLGTSDNQIHRLLNPKILNKNLSQLYHLCSLIGLEFELRVTAA